jgi:hypothetical protein
LDGIKNTIIFVIKSKTMEPFIQFIYSYHVKRQGAANLPFTMDIFKDPKTLLTFAMKELRTSEKKQLVKISCCVYDSTEKQPEWYFDIKGKFWLDDIEAFRKSEGIKSTVPKAYIAEWMSQNA